jgi:DNA-binding response OmpR family regulator
MEHTKYVATLMGSVAINNDNDVICLVDDDPSYLQAIGLLLSSVGLKAKQFTDPHVFLDYAQVHGPRLALLDISMPAMNGLEVQARLRTVSPSTRVIILTARDDNSVRTETIAAGASAFLLKACSEDELVARVRLLLSESRGSSNFANNFVQFTFK